MKKFKSEDTYKINGRGLVKVLKIIQDINIPQTGENIIVDNLKYIVTGLECSYTLGYPRKRNKKVGVLVKLISKE